jgi:hypothetical protein
MASLLLVKPMKNRDHFLQKSLSLLNGYGFRQQRCPT